MGHHVFSPDCMITMKLLSSVFTSMEVLSADICSISKYGCFDLTENRRRWGGGWVDLMWSPRHPAMWCYCGRWSGDPAPSGFLTGIVNSASLWEMASGAGRACDTLLNFTWWKRRGSLLFCFTCAFPSSANQPYSKVCIHSYLFPFPVSHQTHNATQYDSAISKQHVSRI